MTTTTTTRLKPTDRKTQILGAALTAAKRDGYARVTRDAIAREAGCAPGLVSHYLGTMASTRRDIMRAAIRERVLPIVAQGLVAKDPHARRAPADLKEQALASIAG